MRLSFLHIASISLLGATQSAKEAEGKALVKATTLALADPAVDAYTLH